MTTKDADSGVSVESLLADLGIWAMAADREERTSVAYTTGKCADDHTSPLGDDLRRAADFLRTLSARIKELTLVLREDHTMFVQILASASAASDERDAIKQYAKDSADAIESILAPLPQSLEEKETK